MLGAHLSALFLILLVLLQVWIMMRVASERGRSGVKPPAMTGDAALERAIRVQENTIEQLALLLPAYALAATWWSVLWAAVLGLVWIAGRMLYALGYWSEPGKRSAGFMVALAATAVLLVGGSVAWLWTLF